MTDITSMTDLHFTAATAEDFEYFYDLRRTTMLEHFLRASKTWDEQSERFNHRKSFCPETLRMIYLHAERIGFVDISPQGSDRKISLFCIEPRFQNRGIGTLVMRILLNDADRDGVKILLDVLKGNKASHLYERLGFEKIEGDIEILDYYRRAPMP